MKTCKLNVIFKCNFEVTETLWDNFELWFPRDKLPLAYIYFPIKIHIKRHEIRGDLFISLSAGKGGNERGTES